MEIYYFNDSFPIFRFNQYEKHDLASPLDYSSAMLDSILEKYLYEDKILNKITHKIDAVSIGLNMIAEKEGLDLFNSLISIYPTLSFSNYNIKASEIFIDSFSSDLSKTEKINLRNLLDFRLDIKELENELTRINSLVEFKVDFQSVFNHLFVAYYKYCYVTFSKAIDFKFGTPLNLTHLNKPYEFNGEYKFCPKTLKKNATKYFDIIENKTVNAQKYLVASTFIKNLFKSSGVNVKKDLFTILDELIIYAKRKPAERLIYYSFLKNLELSQKITSNRLNRELRSLFYRINKPIFHPEVDTLINRERLTDIQKHLKR